MNDIMSDFINIFLTDDKKSKEHIENYEKDIKDTMNDYLNVFFKNDTFKGDKK